MVRGAFSMCLGGAAGQGTRIWEARVLKHARREGARRRQLETPVPRSELWQTAGVNEVGPWLRQERSR